MWISAEVGTPRTDEQAGTVRVYVGDDPNRPGTLVWEGDWLHASQFTHVLWAAVQAIQGPVPQTAGLWKLGDVRRDPESAVRAVRVSHGRWKLVDKDPLPWCYGWRGDHEVGAWEVLGNVADLPAQADTSGRRA